MRLLAVASLLACDGAVDARRVNVRLVLPSAPDPLAAVERLSFSADHPDFGRTEVPFDAGEGRLELPPIEPGEGWTFELMGSAPGLVVARGRTCAVAIPRTGDLPEPPLLFSLMPYFSRVGAPAAARDSAALLPLASGDALLLGGAAVDPERFRRDAAAFEPAAGPSGSLAATALDDDTLLVVDTDGRAWRLGEDGGATRAGSASAREGAALAPLGDGAILVGGERDGEVLDQTLLWDRGGDFSPGPRLAVARRDATATAVPGVVVVAGGLGADGAPIAALEQTDGDGASFVADAEWKLAQARWSHTATAVGQTVLIVGGLGADGEALRTAEIVRPVEMIVEPAEAFPTARARHTATPVQGGRRVLVAGGAGADGAPIADAFLYDEIFRVLPTDSLQTPRAGHAATELCDGLVLLAGGGDGAEIYNPAPVAP